MEAGAALFRGSGKNNISGSKSRTGYGSGSAADGLQKRKLKEKLTASNISGFDINICFIWFYRHNKKAVGQNFHAQKTKMTRKTGKSRKSERGGVGVKFAK